MRRTMAMVLAAGLMAVAGCGGDDSDDDGGSAQSTPPPAETTPADTGAASDGGGGEKVSLTEFAITPKDASVKAGEVSFAVSNDGQIPHALEIEGNGAEEKTDILTGGQKATLSANLKPGKYEWYCPVGDHRQEGMEGTLTVK